MGWFVTRRVNAAREDDPDEIARIEGEEIDTLPADRDLRLHVVGDCPTEAAARLVAAACERYVERGRLLYKRRYGGGVPKVWAYTHAWRDVPRAAWGVVSVLASCESAAEVREAAARGYAAALVVPEFPRGDKAFARDGVNVVPCREEAVGTVCVDCRLCFDDAKLLKKGAVIGFVPHGRGKRKVSATIQTAANSADPY